MTTPKLLPSTDYLRDRFSYDPDTGILLWRSGPQAGKPAGCIHKSGYHVVTIGASQYSAQRIIWKMMTDEEPPSIVDHKNRNKLDQRWINLREATYVQSSMNRGKHKNNTSGATGVFWYREGWHATIYKEGVQHYLGRFNTFEEAVALRRAKVAEMFGEFYSEDD